MWNKLRVTGFGEKVKIMTQRIMNIPGTSSSLAVYVLLDVAPMLAMVIGGDSSFVSLSHYQYLHPFQMVFFFFLIMKMIVMEDWPEITTNRCESDSCMIRHIGVETAPGCSPHPCHITPSVSFMSFPMNRKSHVHGLAWPLQPLCPFLTHAHFMPTFPYPYSYPFLHTH